jgi:hypothetical protein
MNSKKKIKAAKLLDNRAEYALKKELIIRKASVPQFVSGNASSFILYKKPNELRASISQLKKKKTREFNLDDIIN